MMFPFYYSGNASIRKAQEENEMREQIEGLQRDLFEVKKELEEVRRHTYISRREFGTFNCRTSYTYKLSVDRAIEEILTHLGLELSFKRSEGGYAYIEAPKTFFQKVREKLGCKS
jgi:hypothetical protein